MSFYIPRGRKRLLGCDLLGEKSTSYTRRQMNREVGTDRPGIGYLQALTPGILCKYGHDQKHSPQDVIWPQRPRTPSPGAVCPSSRVLGNCRATALDCRADKAQPSQACVIEC